MCSTCTIGRYVDTKTLYLLYSHIHVIHTYTDYIYKNIYIQILYANRNINNNNNNNNIMSFDNCEFKYTDTNRNSKNQKTNHVFCANFFFLYAASESSLVN